MLGNCKNDGEKHAEAVASRGRSLAEDPNVQHFIGWVETYCDLVENPERLPRLEFLQRLAEALPSLYAAGLRLPKGAFSNAVHKRQSAIRSGHPAKLGASYSADGLESDPYFETVIPTERFFEVRERLAPCFAEYDFRRSVFNPYKDGDAALCSVANDLADVWHDVKQELLLFRKGARRDVAHAVYFWRFNLLNHWGGWHCAAALRAIHEMLAEMSEFNEMGPEPE
ncbi:MAG: DUF5063 domain-containing protein, partial [Planctomycetes bacterium]|nr:DUF5063 domain-containing protein [Planctomycetota bacterium]